MDRIKHLQKLSKLKFDEQEEIKFEAEFDKMLAFVDEIKKVDLPDELEKDKAITLLDLRKDKAEESMPRQEVLSNAPKQKDGCFVTPLVVE